MGKRGPTKKDGKRETNGRLSRIPTEKQVRDEAKMQAEEWETMQTALMARWRVHKVEPKHLRDQMAGSFVGRLCLSGELSRQQYDAAQSYLEERQQYHIAINAPKQMGAVDLNAVHGRSNGENVARSKKAVVDFAGPKGDGNGGTLGAIREKQNELRGNANLYAALDLCVVRDEELMHMVGDTRIALNALAKHYGLEGRKAA